MDMEKGDDYIKLIGLVVLLIVGNSCSMDPEIRDQGTTKVESIKDGRTMLNGSYSTMEDYRYWGRAYILIGEIRSDNTFANGNSGFYDFWSEMKIVPQEAQLKSIFKYPYGVVANPNLLINSDLDELDGNEDDKNHLLGEAYAIRTFAHFDLLRIFGQQYVSEGSDLGISYVKKFEGEVEKTPRSTYEENKQQLYDDIDEAIDYLKKGKSSEYEGSKVNFTLDAAYALKSRIATYFKDYKKAEKSSKKIVDKYNITKAEDYADYWKQDVPGDASIFELELNSTDNNESDNIGNYYRTTSGSAPIELFKNLREDAGIEKADVRGSEEMIGIDDKGALRNFGKYPDNKHGTDNIKIFRIEEVVLNYAEALLMEGDKKDALEYLNRIPKNRDAKPYESINIENILKERRKEFLFEGFRFYDLARYNLGIREMDSSVPFSHGEISPGSYKFAAPIPEHELQANDVEQNPGY